MNRKLIGTYLLVYLCNEHNNSKQVSISIKKIGFSYMPVNKNLKMCPFNKLFLLKKASI
jgi:hypothetical protein